ncbi:MAG: bifunctional adenosylcobinamide kinase/adenosylcobinamide-phosphate guanylyltransferase [Lachnospiraceae bacterium]|nr:bifunctional adenosylcobinamide kinase/adenosylcobinamide-phosphate guanylyltransferase [Lachnospiraceae bacterium]
MIQLIIGTNSSGKSLEAERIACSFKASHRYYLATMLIYDDDGKERVKKHRRQRQGKGFETIEIPYAIDSALESMTETKDSVVLLECISNLVGNEMYENPQRKELCKINPELFADSVANDVRKLSQGVRDIIIVTNEYAADDNSDEMTRLYIKLCHMVNERIKAFADEVLYIKKETI